MKKILYIVLAIPLIFIGAKKFAEAENVIEFGEPETNLFYQVAEGELEDPEAVEDEITLEDLEILLQDIATAQVFDNQTSMEIKDSVENIESAIVSTP